MFCRPKLTVLETLSQYVETIPNQDSLNASNRLCRDLNCEDFIIHSTLNIRQYSLKVCPLQIYAALLENSVHQLEIEQFISCDITLTSVAQIAINTMNFLRECLKRPWNWMAIGTNGTLNKRGCNSYSYMICSAITQLYVVIKCWFNNMTCLGKIIY